MHLEDLMKRFVTFIGLLLVWVVSCPQPLSVSVSASPNGICSGTGCEYEGPTIMINEVMLKPVEGMALSWEAPISAKRCLANG